MSVSHISSRKPIFFEPFFYFLNKKLWYQIKFLIQDLLLFSSHISFLVIKKDGKTIEFFNRKKLISFYQKFKKILRKYLSPPRKIFFLICMVKDELFYIEDKIIFIENELNEIKKKKHSWFSCFLQFNLLFRYYIFLNVSQKKKNWGKQCAIVGRKNKNNTKIQFNKFVSQRTQLHLNKKLYNTFDSYRKTKSKEEPLFIHTISNSRERETFSKRVQFMLSFRSNQRSKKKSKKKKKNTAHTAFQSHLPALFLKIKNVRHGFEKQDWFFDINTFRTKKKSKMVSYFFEKPKIILLYSVDFLTFQKKKSISSILNICKKKRRKKKIRWSFFSKIFMFFFQEIEFFFINCFRKKNSYYFIDHNRQLIDNFFFFCNYAPEHKKNLIEQSDILWRRVLPIFFNLTNAFFADFSFF